MMTITEMMAIGIHGTRAGRRAPAVLRAGHNKRHNRRRGLTAGRADCGGSAMAIAPPIISLPRHTGEVPRLTGRRGRPHRRSPKVSDLESANASTEALPLRPFGPPPP